MIIECEPSGGTTSTPSPIDSPPSRLTFTIDDCDLFAEITSKAQAIVRKRLKAMRIIHASKGVWRACVTISSSAGFHMERGCSAARLHSLYLAFCETGGDWRTLVDGATAGKAWQNYLTGDFLPAAFLDFLAQQWGQKQRGKFASVYSELKQRLKRWRNGDSSAAIPGYKEPPPPGHIVKNDPDLPLGWTYGNLARRVKPRLSKFSRTLIRIGPKAASSLGPQLPGTRFGLSVGRYYILDDSWNDFQVIAYGQSCRLLAFHVLDLFSGCNIARGYKPALKVGTTSTSSEKQTEERLREKEMIWLLVKFLTSGGYLSSGTTIICEKGTATIRERERGIFADCGIPISVQDGPSGGGPGIAGLCTGPGGGNPRWKAPLESWFNLLRNRTDDLLEFPGQTGSNSRLNRPEGLAGLENDSLALLKAARAMGLPVGTTSMSSPTTDLLQLGLLPFHEAIFKLDAVTEVACNCRTDHNLEAWRQCGNYVQEFRLPISLPDLVGDDVRRLYSRWLPMDHLLSMDPSERKAISELLHNSPESHSHRLTRERALSPREVYDSGKSSLTKLPLSVAALLMADLPAIEATVKNCTLSLSCPEVDPDAPLTFGLTRRDGRGTQTPLRNDEKFGVIVNPLDPRVAWLFTADRKFAGVTDFYGRVQRDDPGALQRAFSAKRSALAPLIEESRRAAANITRAATDRAAHNAAILGPTPAKLAEQKTADAEFDSARASLRKAASTF